MAKVLILNGSPHLEGYLSSMIETLNAALEKNNIQSIQYNLAFMNIHDSIGEDFPIHDDMEGVLESLDECDYIMLASPLYCYSFSGYLKCALDRLAHLPNIENKKLICLISMGSEDETSIEPLKAQCVLLAKYLKWELTDFLYIKGCKKPTNIALHTAELERVYQAGLKIK